YFSLLVFMTQKLAMLHNTHETRTLTAIHDNTVAWTGIGSAISTLLGQISVPASVISTLAV
ncbi:hypothetical protein DFH09DRAFT_846218, partial [Mycena vulgaris]